HAEPYCRLRVGVGIAVELPPAHLHRLVGAAQFVIGHGAAARGNAGHDATRIIEPTVDLADAEEERLWIDEFGDAEAGYDRADLLAEVIGTPMHRLLASRTHPDPPRARDRARLQRVPEVGDLGQVLRHGIVLRVVDPPAALLLVAGNVEQLFSQD